MTETKTSSPEVCELHGFLGGVLERIEKSNSEAHASISLMAAQAVLKAEASLKENSNLALSVAAMVEKVNSHCSRNDIHGANNYALIHELNEEFRSHKKWLMSILVTLVGALAGVIWEMVSAHLK